MTSDQKSQDHPPRPHDMGGRFGDGTVIPDDDAAPVFTQDWHGRALALTLAAGALGAWNLDISRHARECLKPEDYSRFSYYEKWLAALADLLHAHGVVRLEELQSGQSSGVSPLPQCNYPPIAWPRCWPQGGPPIGLSQHLQNSTSVRRSKRRSVATPWSKAATPACPDTRKASRV